MNDSYISYGATKIPLGLVTSIQDNLMATVTSIKIPTQRAESAFTVDSGTIEEYVVVMERGCPAKYDDRSTDPSMWSNARWVSELEALVNRWQMKTDGCRLTIRPDTSDCLGDVDENGYVSSLSISYSAGMPDLVSVTLKLKVGTMYMGSTRAPEIPNEDMYVMISDTEGSASYYLLCKGNGKFEDINCIKDYRIRGGLEQPFEYLTMSVPKKRLDIYMDNLNTRANLIAGRNVITVNAYGKAQFVVTKCKQDGGDFRITAYSVAEAFRGATTAEEYSSSDKNPFAIISAILSSGLTIGSSLNIAYTGASFITNVDESTDWSGEVVFPTGSNCWYVLQVCALRLGARMFFAENRAYLIDSKKECAEIPNYGLIEPFKESTNDDDISNSVVGKARVGDEGASTVVNTISIKYGDNSTLPVESTCSESKPYYGLKSGGTLHIREIHNEQDAREIAENYMSILSDSQTSIGFFVKELNSKGWVETFPPLACADSIRESGDDKSEANITNISHCSGRKMQNLLMLSTFERNYPEGTSEYWWGIQQKVDFSQTISQIQNALNN